MIKKRATHRIFTQILTTTSINTTELRLKMRGDHKSQNQYSNKARSQAFDVDFDYLSMRTCVK